MSPATIPGWIPGVDLISGGWKRRRGRRSSAKPVMLPVLITGPNNCFNEIITTLFGQYEIKLPAIPDITVTVTEIDGQPVDQVFTEGRFETSKTVSMVRGDTLRWFLW